VRARRVGQLLSSAAALAVVVALIGGWLAWDRHRLSGGQGEPSQGPSAPAIPSDLYAPAPWTPSLEEGEPFGQVAAFGSADWRPHFYSSQRSAIYVVSATTGVYRFLDLPGIGDTSPGDTVALSPNGRYVAYSVATPTPVTGTPGPASIRFWDAETGQVTQVAIDSDRGSSQTGLSWSPNSNLVAFEVDRYTGPTGETGEWFSDVAAVGTAEITLNLVGGPTDFAGWTADSQSAVWGSQLRSFNVTTGKQSTLLSKPLDINVLSWASSPDGNLWVAGGFNKHVSLVNVITGSVRPLRVPPGRVTYNTSVSWIDRDKVAVSTVSDVHGDQHWGVWSVGLDDNRVTPLINCHRLASCTIESFATDLLTQPVRHEAKPDWGNDPRHLFLWTGIAIAMVALALVLWTPIWPVVPQVRTSEDPRLSGLDGDNPKD
jgi:hypothetical protein